MNIVTVIIVSSWCFALDKLSNLFNYHIKMIQLMLSIEFYNGLRNVSF